MIRLRVLTWLPAVRCPRYVLVRYGTHSCTGTSFVLAVGCHCTAAGPHVPAPVRCSRYVLIRYGTHTWKVRCGWYWLGSGVYPWFHPGVYPCFHLGLYPWIYPGGSRGIPLDMPDPYFTGPGRSESDEEGHLTHTVIRERSVVSH